MKKTALTLAFALAAMPAAFGQTAGQTDKSGQTQTDPDTTKKKKPPKKKKETTDPEKKGSADRSGSPNSTYPTNPSNPNPSNPPATPPR